MIECPLCRRERPADTHDAVSIELHGGCLWCRHSPRAKCKGTEDELTAVDREVKRRRDKVVWRAIE